MDVVTLTGELPDLRRPTLVAAFEGWNDAGECASMTIDRLQRGLDATPFGEIEPEEFFDFQHVRPMVRNEGDGSRALVWPRNTLSWAHLPDAPHDLVFLDGTEPNLRWKTFAGGILELARDLGVGTVITVGALQVDVPHTRPVPLTVTSPDPGLAAELRLARSTYEGPTGMTGVLHSLAAEGGVPSLSMWAGVPHYLSAAAYLPGALALTERLSGLIGAAVPLEHLALEAASQTEEISELLATDEELADYVAELELRSNAGESSMADGPIGELPESDISGDELAAELERYLRDHDR